VPNKSLLLPCGRLAYRVVVEAVLGARITEFDDDGEPTWTTDAVPDFEHYSPEIVVEEGVDYSAALERNCRVVTLPDKTDGDEYDEAPPYLPWPADIQAACNRMLTLVEMKGFMAKAQRIAPRNWLNPILDAALNGIAMKHIDDEIEALDAKVREFRRGEPTDIVMPAPEEIEEPADA